MPTPSSGYQTGIGYANFVNSWNLIQGADGQVYFRLNYPELGAMGYIEFTDPCRGWTAEQILVCELYQVYLNNGASAFFCNYDTDISTGGYSYQAIPIRRSTVGLYSDLQVDNVNIDMGLIGVKLVSKTSDDTLQLSIPQSIRSELFRDSRVKIFSHDYVNDVSKFMFEGYVTDTSWSSGVFSFSVASILNKLNDRVPKVVYSELCNHKLYDGRCGISRLDSNFTASGTVNYQDPTNPKSVLWSADLVYTESYPQGWWFRGEVEITNSSSSNYGLRRSVISHSDSEGNYYVQTSAPFPNNISVGDTFQVWAGCDRTGTMCVDKFNNYTNFFGFEYIPRPETLTASL